MSGFPGTPKWRDLADDQRALSISARFLDFDPRWSSALARNDKGENPTQRPPGFDPVAYSFQQNWGFENQNDVVNLPK